MVVIRWEDYFCEYSTFSVSQTTFINGSPERVRSIGQCVVRQFQAICKSSIRVEIDDLDWRGRTEATRPKVNAEMIIG